MPKLITVYNGWVGGREIDRIELEAIGVEILQPWNPAGFFDRVQMSTDVYELFRRRWTGRYTWGLRARKVEVYTPQELEEDIPF